MVLCRMVTLSMLLSTMPRDGSDSIWLDVISILCTLCADFMRIVLDRSLHTYCEIMERGFVEVYSAIGYVHATQRVTAAECITLNVQIADIVQANVCNAFQWQLCYSQMRAAFDHHLMSL